MREKNYDRLYESCEIHGPVVALRHLLLRGREWCGLRRILQFRIQSHPEVCGRGVGAPGRVMDVRVGRKLG